VRYCLYNTLTAMRLSVKVLGGSECCVDAQDDYTVEQLKADIEAKLKLGKTEQKLLFKGKTLQDGTFLSSYKLTDGSKLNLILKRDAAVASSTTNSGSSRQNSPAAESISSKEATFEEELAKHLRKHFKSEADTKKVISTFMAVYHRKLSALSLDDVERISRNYQETKELSF